MTKALRKYIDRGHRLVGGWLAAGAVKMVTAVALAQQKAGIAGNVAEIGVHHGRLFILLYLLAEGSERAVAIDLFSLQHLNVGQSGAGDLACFLANLQRHAGGRERLIVHEGDSTQLDGEALVQLAGGRCRLISIDGGHTQEITAKDLATAESALAPGGIIILDDCFNEIWPAVSGGVHDYFRSKRMIVPFAIGANKTLFCHPEFVEEFTGVLRGLGRFCLEQDFLGSPVLCIDFSPATLAERIGRWPAWHLVKDTSAGRLVRGAYRAKRKYVG